MSEEKEFILFWPEVPEIFLPENKRSLAECKCSFCNQSLTEKTYVIEKSLTRDLITKQVHQEFEIYICTDCATELNKEISEESKQRITQFQQKRLEMPYRQKLFDSNNLNINQWLKYCIITNKRIDQQEEFHIAGLFFGDKMLYDDLPMAVSMDGLMKIEELYSKKTRDALDDFYEKLPPDILSKVKDKPLAMI